MYIVLCEGDLAVLRVMSKSLSNVGYEVVQTTSGTEALDLFQRERVPDLLVTDLVLPGSMSGFALINSVLTLAPDVPILVVTGLFRNVPRFSTHRYRNLRLLRKPFHIETLRDAVAELLPPDHQHRDNAP
ncbi:MAG: response regulator [Pseudomonadota bacterium]